MTRTFKNPNMQRLYKAMTENPPNRSGMGTAAAFWRGWDGIHHGYAKNTLAHAAYMAGKDLATKKGDE